MEPETPTNTDEGVTLTEEQFNAIQGAAHSGANWFYWIAGLSVVNTIAALSGAHFSMVIGLGITQFFDAVAMHAGSDIEPEHGALIQGIAIAASFFMAAGFACIGYLSRLPYVWAYILGMVLYLLDGVLFLLVGEWFSLVFHGVALYFLWNGLAPTRFIAAVRREIKASERQANAEAKIASQNTRQFGE